jgi:hypothetical protein
MVRGRPPSLPQARIRLRKPFSPHFRRRASTLLRANDIAAALVRIMATIVTLRRFLARSPWKLSLGEARLDAADFVKKVVAFLEPDQLDTLPKRCNLFSEMAISQPHKWIFCTDRIGRPTDQGK